MKYLNIVGVLACVFSQSSVAAGPPVNHVFKKGDAALSSQVNENFQQLADRIQDVTPVVYDYKNYLAPMSLDNSKTFAQTDTMYTSKLVESVVKHDVASDTNPESWTVRWGTFDSTNIETSRIEYDYEAGTNGLLLKQQSTYYSNAGNWVLSETQKFSPAILLRPSNLQVGRSWGFASEITITNYSANPQSTSMGFWQGLRTLAAVEPVKINENSSTPPYPNCLKIVTTNGRDSGATTTGITGVFVQTDWFCAGLGLVKRVTSSGAYGSSTRLTIQ